MDEGGFDLFDWGVAEREAIREVMSAIKGRLTMVSIVKISYKN